MIRKHSNPSVPGLTRDEPHPATAQKPEKTKAAAAAPATARPSHHEIARRAYEIYLGSGCVAGRCERNWHQAERELEDEHVVRIDSPSTYDAGPLRSAVSDRSGALA